MEKKAGSPCDAGRWPVLVSGMACLYREEKIILIMGKPAVWKENKIMSMNVSHSTGIVLESH